MTLKSHYTQPTHAQNAEPKMLPLGSGKTRDAAVTLMLSLVGTVLTMQLGKKMKFWIHIGEPRVVVHTTTPATQEAKVGESRLRAQVRQHY